MKQIGLQNVRKSQLITTDDKVLPCYFVSAMFGARFWAFLQNCSCFYKILFVTPNMLKSQLTKCPATSDQANWASHLINTDDKGSVANLFSKCYVWRQIWGIFTKL